LPQAIPAGVLVTVPDPVLLTESVELNLTKVAVTDLSPSRESPQPPLSEQAPPQLWNLQPWSATATSETSVPVLN